MRSGARRAVALALAGSIAAACASAPKAEQPQVPAPAAEPSPAAPADAIEPAGADAAPRVRPDDLRDVVVLSGDPVLAPVLRHWGTNPTVDVLEEPTSRFGVDVDTASFSLARAALRDGRLPPPEGVRVEEMVNAVRYGWRAPTHVPFSVVAELFPSPNRTGYHVLLLGLRARDVAVRPAADVVVVLDVSGSMRSAQIAVMRASVRALARGLRSDDTITVVLLGSSARTIVRGVAPSSADVEQALHAVAPEGATNLQAGLMHARAEQRGVLRPGRVGRVLLFSDGLATAGSDDVGVLLASAAPIDRSVVHTFCVGAGPQHDVLLEAIAARGGGRYALLADDEDVRRALVDGLAGLLHDVVTDVRVEVGFDAEGASRYRLIGFENRSRDGDRALSAPGSVAAGSLGAGQEMTALYEVKLKPGAARVGHLRVTSRRPGGEQREAVDVDLPMSLARPTIRAAAAEGRLAWAVAAWGEKLRGSYWVRGLRWEQITSALEHLPPALRGRADVRELEGLVRRSQALDRGVDRFEAVAPTATMDWDNVPTGVP